ncbi:MAG: hypothetical protein R3C14_13760 [Caldilineaceae bacterium]
MAQRVDIFRMFAGVLVALAIISSGLWQGQLWAQVTGPTLTIPQAIAATVGHPVLAPVDFRAGGAAVASLTFSIDFDESCLGFDDSDSNNDGLLDHVHFSKPAAFQGSVSYAAADLAGELDIVIADFSPPFAILPDTDGLVTIEFIPLCSPTGDAPLTAAIGFSHAPTVSFGDPGGRDLKGITSGGTVVIANPATATTTPTATATSTTTPLATPTTTSTALPTATATAKATTVASPTATATATVLLLPSETVPATPTVTTTATATAPPTATATATLQSTTAPTAVATPTATATTESVPQLSRIFLPWIKQ